MTETAGGITTTFLVDELNPTGYPQVVEELVGGVVQRTYTYGRDLISQNHWNGSVWTPSYHLADGLGSVRTLTDSSGSATDSYTYDAFGSHIATSGSTPNRYGFTGEQFDDDLGLYYLRARYYNQGNGRFLSRDTYPLDQSSPREWNRYSYVAGDPVNATDPSGRMMAERSLNLQRVAIPTTVLGLTLGEWVAVTFLAIVLCISGQEAIDILKRLGCQVLRISGSHHMISCPGGCQTVVPVHGNRDIPQGTLSNIRRHLRPCIPDINQRLR